MPFLESLFKKFRTLFVKQTKHAAQVWQERGGEAKHAYWMYAAPVNLLLGRDSFFLAEPAPLAMTDEESLALINSLNHHFSRDGYHFYRLDGDWFLGLDTAPNIATSHIEQVIGHDIAAYLPKGDGASAWAAFQNELQMLLFDHPVNVEREKQGLSVMNSIWFYGVGATV